MGLRSAALALVVAACSPSGAEGWTFEESTDPISDARRGFAVLRGEGGAIAIKCDENGPNSIYIHIITEEYLGMADDVRRVIVRLDDGPPATYYWLYGDHGALETDNREAAKTALALSRAKKIALRLTDYNSEDVDLLLMSDGDATAVRRAFTTCGQAGGLKAD